MQALTITIIISMCFLWILVLILNTTSVITQTNQNKKMSLCSIKKTEDSQELLFTNENWTLEIPKINLMAKINYGTTDETINEFVGHFDTTKFWNGNIGLAAHNRGYPVNYFGKLKELQIGDEIKYTTIYGTKTYKVVISTIIQDTDWSYLENTKDNRITLITCVENEPKYGRCIQAIEI